MPSLHLNRGPGTAARTAVDPKAVADAKKKRRKKGYDSDEENEKAERKRRKLVFMTDKQRHDYMIRRMDEDYVSSDIGSDDEGPGPGYKNLAGAGREDGASGDEEGAAEEGSYNASDSENVYLDE